MSRVERKLSPGSAQMTASSDNKVLVNLEQWQVFWKFQILGPMFPFFSLSSVFKVKKNKGQRRSGQKEHCVFVLSPLRESIAGLEMLVMSWRRTPSPGLTVKGAENLLSTSCSEPEVLEWGKGSQVVLCAMTSCCHLLATEVTYSRGELALTVETTEPVFNHSGSKR